MTQTIRDQLESIAGDARKIQARVMALLPVVDAWGIDGKELKLPNINGPVTAPACMWCGVGDGHSIDCEAAERYDESDGS